MLKVEKNYSETLMHQATQNCLLFFPAAICNKNNHNLAFRNLNLDAQLGPAVGESLHTGYSINFGSGSLTDNPTGSPSSVLRLPLIGFFLLLQLFRIVYAAVCSLCMTAKCNILEEALYVYVFFLHLFKNTQIPVLP